MDSLNLLTVMLPLLATTFNSIEWILRVPRLQLLQDSRSFNSIEWILKEPPETPHPSPQSLHFQFH